MLLEQVLSQAPDAPSLLLRRDVYADDDQPALIRDVLAAANAAAGVARHVLFGVEAMGGRIHVHGLDTYEMERFRELCRGIAELIEPDLRLTPILADAHGKSIAGLEVSGCENPPYTLRKGVAEDMRTGACWVQAGGDLRPARREDLERIYARRAAVPAVPVEIGLNQDPGCLLIQLDVPDTWRPPSQRARAKLLSAINASKSAAGVLGREDTGMARLAHARIFGADEPYVQRGVDTLVEQYNCTTDEYSDADNYYYYEQQAVKLDFAVRNNQAYALDGVEVELDLPQVPGFQVAGRLYFDPADGGSEIESRLAGYPEVHKGTGRATVNVMLGTLQPGVPQPLFERSLRLHVGPEMCGMKVAIKYQLTAKGLAKPIRGRLKLVFRKQSGAKSP